jgi:hypothetical protein
MRDHWLLAIGDDPKNDDFTSKLYHRCNIYGLFPTWGPIVGLLGEPFHPISRNWPCS